MCLGEGGGGSDPKLSLRMGTAMTSIVGDFEEGKG
jgi:hypothetical protein